MARTRTRAAHAALLLSSAVALLAPLRCAGVLPIELEPADLARRVAATRLGARELAAAGDAAAPTLGDLRMGELPFTAMALAFRGLGLDATAGRLPFAIAAIAAVAAIWALCVRAARPRVGALAVCVLVTCPLFALHARTMVGDGIAIASFAIAWSGLTGSVIERAPRAIAAWLSVGALGLAAGYLARGALLGVATPLVAVGLAALASQPLLPEASRTRARLAVAFAAVGALAAAIFTWRAAPIAAARGDEVLRVVGISLAGAPAGEATFDRIVRQIGHAAFPWSALAPFALGRLLGGPPPRRAAGEPPRDGALRIHALSAVIVSFCATTAIVPWAGDVPWIGVAGLAVVVALGLDDLAERPSRDATAALVTVALGAVLAVDLARSPDRLLAALSVDDAALPPGLDEDAALWLAIVAGGSLAPLGLALAPRERGAEGSAGRLRAATAAARAVLAAWEGWLAFLLVVVEAALAGLAAMVLIGRWLGWDAVLRLSRPTTRVFLHAFWIVPLVSVAAPAAVAGARAILVSLARRLGVSVPTIAAAAATASALAFSVGFHGEVAARSSPEGALEAHAVRAPDEPLGLVGLGDELARFHGARDARTFEDPTDALPWLVDGPGGQRRWLVVPSRDLARLNALHRARLGRNVPVADASGAALLVTSDLRGAADASPLSDVVLDAPPAPQRPVLAELDGTLQVLGWEVRDEDGDPVDEVSAGTAYRARFFVRSLAPLAPSYRPFLHVERARLRWNGDEVFVDRGYPSVLWQPGDVVVLECALELDPNFGPGAYDVWFGFFAAGARLPVVDGPASGDRVRMGSLLVR